MEAGKPRNDLPDAAAARVRGQAKQDCEQRDRAKADRELGRIARGDPRRAERAILVLAPVLHALRERPAVVARVSALALGQPDNGGLAPPEEAVAHGDLGAQDGDFVYEPKRG